MILDIIIDTLRFPRDTLTKFIELAESIRDVARNHGSDQPPQVPMTGGLTWGSIHGHVDPGRGFRSIYDQPHEPGD